MPLTSGNCKGRRAFEDRRNEAEGTSGNESSGRIEIFCSSVQKPVEGLVLWRVLVIFNRLLLGQYWDPSLRGEDLVSLKRRTHYHGKEEDTLYHVNK